MKLTTTLAKIRACSPCSNGYTKLVKHLGGIEAYGADTPINLLTILASNGVQDMLWCLRAVNEDGKRAASMLAIEFAAEALPIFEKRYPDDLRPRQCIQAVRDYLAGKIDVATLRQARSAAAAAAAADAAYAAYARAKAVARQADIIRSILEE